MNFRQCSNLTTSIHPSFTAQKKSLNSSPHTIQQTKPSYTKKATEKALTEAAGIKNKSVSKDLIQSPQSDHEI
jgi:hypothetical protein